VGLLRLYARPPGRSALVFHPRDTYVPFSEQRAGGGCDSLRERGFLWKDAAPPSPRDDPFTSALNDPLLVSPPDHLQGVPLQRRKIPPSAWETVLQCAEQGEPPRRIARGGARVI
jgi:hypothetical protein